MRNLRAIGLGVLLFSGARPASATILHFKALLTGAQELPPVETRATGRLSATIDTSSGALVYSATYSGLSGPPTRAGFHASTGVPSNPPVALSTTRTSRAISGKAMLQDGQIGDLMADMWYFNVATRAHPDGEIRGQLTPAR